MRGARLELVLPGWPEPGSPLTGNGRRHAHWTSQRRATHKVHEMIWAILQENQKEPLPRWERVKIEVTFVVPDNRRRDAMNLHIACKPIEDALVLLQIMPDDDTKHCQTTSQVVIEPGVRQCRVSVEEWT